MVPNLTDATDEATLPLDSRRCSGAAQAPGGLQAKDGLPQAGEVGATEGKYRQDTTKPQAVDDLGFCVLVGPAGLEPATCGLKVRSSTS